MSELSLVRTLLRYGAEPVYGRNVLKLINKETEEDVPSQELLPESIIVMTNTNWGMSNQTYNMTNVQKGPPEVEMPINIYSSSDGDFLMNRSRTKIYLPTSKHWDEKKKIFDESRTIIDMFRKADQELPKLLEELYLAYTLQVKTFHECKSIATELDALINQADVKGKSIATELDPLKKEAEVTKLIQGVSVTAKFEWDRSVSSVNKRPLEFHMVRCYMDNGTETLIYAKPSRHASKEVIVEANRLHESGDRQTSISHRPPSEREWKEQIGTLKKAWSVFERYDEDNHSTQEHWRTVLTRFNGFLNGIERRYLNSSSDDSEIIQALTFMGYTVKTYDNHQRTTMEPTDYDRWGGITEWKNVTRDVPAHTDIDAEGDDPPIQKFMQWFLGRAPTW